MKLTFPRMGHLHIGVKAIMEALGNQVIVPPPISEYTLELGSKWSPETACLPLKLNLGNYMEVLEQHTLDAIVMAGGVGPCRFGYYYRTQQDVLREWGSDVEWIVLEPPRGNLSQVLEGLSRITHGASVARIAQAIRLGWVKLSVLDELQQKIHIRRPFERQRGALTHLFDEFSDDVDRLNSVADVRRAFHRARGAVDALAKGDAQAPLRIALLGEVYMLLEPAANFFIEESLGQMGVQVMRTTWITDWVKDNILLDFLRWDKRSERIEEAAKPYLNHFVGGHGLDTIGSSSLYSEQVDGVIHLMPFTCMPEIVAQTVMPALSADLDLPVLTLVYDEHTGRAGTLTRLEAFVDLLLRRKSRDPRVRSTGTGGAR